MDGRARSRAARSKAICAMPSRAASSSCIYQPFIDVADRQRSSASRRWCAGSIRARPDPAGPVHSARRGNRPDRAARRMGAAAAPATTRRGWPRRHHGRGEPVAGPVPAGRAVRRSSASALQNSGLRAGSGWSSRSPNPCCCERALENHAFMRAAQEPRRRARARRFRHRLFVAQLPAPRSRSTRSRSTSRSLPT